MKHRNKLQKWLGIGTIIFVAIYLGAIIITITSKTEVEDRPAVIEAAREYEQEKHLILPELLLPMGIMLSLALSYLIIRRRNIKKYDRLDEDSGEKD